MPLGLLVLIISLFWLLSFRTDAVSAETGNKLLKVGFIMAGPVSDYGWNQAHNDGRLYLEKTMHGRVQTVFAEKIPENAEAARVMERMIAQGAKIIFLTTYGYLDSALSVAAHHPDIIFMQVNRLSDKKLANLGIYFCYYYEQMYVAGIVAGRMTKSNKIGFVAAHVVPVVLAAANAFTLGARSVNSKVRVQLVCTNSWNDPVTESEATRALADSGADVIVACSDSALTTCLSAEKARVYCIGMTYDLNKQVPKAWLTGQWFNYGPLYASIVQEVINGSWKPGTRYYNIKDGYVQLASFGKAVPLGVQKEALVALQKLKEDKLAIFHGPLKDASGKEWIPAGKIADNNYLQKIDWAVAGLECALPKK
jgi:basic membrane lipoprotein Med (substrate-binding protein (PBP1-ABC) superfamily)